MLNKNMKFFLIISLAFNLAFIGALGYRIIEKKSGPTIERKKYYQKFHKHGEEMEKLHFSPELQEKLKKVRDKFSAKIHDHRQNLIRERMALGKLLLQDEPDSIKIMTRLEQIGRYQLDIEREILFQILEEKEILPPDHRQAFLEQVVQRLERMGTHGPRGSHHRKDQPRPPEGPPPSPPEPVEPML